MLSFRFVNRFPLRALCIGMAVAGSISLAQADEVDDIRAMLSAGRAADALKKTEQLLASKPKDARLLLQKGIALSSLNRTNEAITVFQKLIEAHPEHPGPYNNLAVLYASQGDYDKARQSLELAIKTNPNYATAFQNLGDVYARLAGQAYKKALALDKSDAALPLKLSVIQNVFEPSVDPRQKTATAPAAPTKPVTAAPAPAPTSTAANTPITAPVVAPTKAPTPAPAPAPTTTAAATKPTPTPSPTPAPTSASTKVATAPTAVATTTPAPAKPEAPKVDAAEQEKQAVEKALRAWAQAWSQRDMFAYYAAYASDFKGKSPSRKAWEADRHARITGKKKISVELSDIKVKLDGNKAIISFRQNYTSDALSAKSGKTIEMVKGKSGTWQITAENSN